MELQSNALFLDPGMACEVYVPAPPASSTAPDEKTFKERNFSRRPLTPGLCGHSGQKPRARRSLPGPNAGHPLQGAAVTLFDSVPAACPTGQ